MKGRQPLFSIYTRLGFRAILVLVYHWGTVVRCEHDFRGHAYRK
jgi:hypothetical protein